MSNENSPPPTPTSPSPRRASFSPGQKFSELFGRSPTNNGAAMATPAYPGPITVAAAHAQQRRRTSVAALGLGGSPTQASFFPNGLNRRSSISSSIEENAIEEGDAAPDISPSSPFARRMSFGARALRDVRAGTGGSNGRPSTDSASPPSFSGRGLSSGQASTADPSRRVSNHFSQRSGEGFNWSEQIRSRAKRSASIGSPGNFISQSAVPPEHVRTPSIATVQPPVKQVPTPKPSRKPDLFQERILKGDFYMD